MQQPFLLTLLDYTSFKISRFFFGFNYMGNNAYFCINQSCRIEAFTGLVSKGTTVDVDNNKNGMFPIVQVLIIVDLVSLSVNNLDMHNDCACVQVQAEFQAISLMIHMRHTKFHCFCYNQTENILFVTGFSLNTSHDVSSSSLAPGSMKRC